MKDNNSVCQKDIRVNGHYVCEVASGETAHRIYHYQVSISSTMDQQPTIYERELHICETLHPADECPPPDTDTDTDTDTIHDAAKTPEITPEPPLSAESLLPADDKPELALPDTTLTRPQRVMMAADISSRLQNQWHRARTFTHGQAIKLAQLCNRDSLPISRLITLFKQRGNYRHLVISLLIAAIVSLLLVVLRYSLYQSDETTTKTTNVTPVISHPATKPLNGEYQAVIEKTDEGVVITLQGPDHEEVLTKLPPGYYPVVEDNKIVHIVTPGNTLWFIAKRYVKNPYRYPELARLNDIKNPDLIYPGEKVIIQHIRKP